MKYYYLIMVALLSTNIYAQNQITNTIYIDQIGSYNSIMVNQDGLGHAVSITMGSSSGVDNTTVAIDQRDSGAKTATVNITGGINNGVDILQQGAGNHTTSITNLNGIANSITINQNGAGNHTLEIAGATGAQNNGNTITATQSGGVGADKTFTLGLNGWNTNVAVEQSNPTTAGQASMNITCGNSCGTQPWSYISR